MALARHAPSIRETALRKKIQILEETVNEYERQKYNVMGTFSEYRERVAERERNLEAEYSSKIIALSEDVLAAKKDFELRMNSFQKLQEKFEREKEAALEKLRQQHQREIALLEQRLNEPQLLNLEQKYMIEIARLEEERKSLRAEKERLGETFDVKLRRAQSMYEQELQAAKMLYSRELEALRDHEHALKEELSARQEEFYDRLNELQHQSKRSREELAVCKSEVWALEKTLTDKQKEVDAISRELDDARSETEEHLRTLARVEGELRACRERYETQEEELRKKTNLLNIVETAKSKLEAVIRDLQAEVRALKNKVEFLEKERVNLQSQSESQTKLHHSQVHALEAVLETVTKEKESARDAFESQLAREREQADVREHAMKKEFAGRLNRLEQDYSAMREQVDAAAQLDRAQAKELADQEIASIRSEKRLVESQLAMVSERLRALLDSESSGGNAAAAAASSSEDCGMLEVIRQTDDLRAQLDAKSQLVTEQLTELQQLRRKVAQTEQQKLASEDEQKIKQALVDAGELVEPAQLDKIRLQLDDMTQRCRAAEKQALELDKLRAEAAELRAAVEAGREHADEADRLKAELDQTRRAMRTRTDDESEALRAESALKTARIEQLVARVDQLDAELSGLRAQLAKKASEVEAIERKQKSDHSSSSDGKLEEELKNATNELEKERRKAKEHEHQLAETKAEFARKLVEIEHDYKRRLDEHERELSPQLVVDTRDFGTQVAVTERDEDGDLKKRVAELEHALIERNRQVEQLEQALSVIGETSVSPPAEDFESAQLISARKPERSQSVATPGEHMAMCRRAASKLLSTMRGNTTTTTDETAAQQPAAASTQKTDQGSVQTVQTTTTTTTAAQQQQPSKLKQPGESVKSSKHAAKEDSPSTSAAATGTSRAKSPSLLTRLRERSPAKPKAEKEKEEKSRRLLSPADAERRASPSRPLFGRTRKESSKDKDDSGSKRPAWKF